MRIRLLLCFLSVFLAVHGQEASLPADSVLIKTDTTARIQEHDMALAIDSSAAAQSDSLVSVISKEMVAGTDTAGFKPIPQKSLWYAALFPGLGQIYNRRYWKLPIVAGAAVGVTYAITWNNKYYEAYTYAYRDMTDNDPTTNYHIEVFGDKIASEQTIQNRQQTFRRQRDLSIIIGVALYLLSVLDAYVDAELFNFDISDDISLEMGRPSSSPTMQFPVNEQKLAQTTPISLSWNITF